MKLKFFVLILTVILFSCKKENSTIETLKGTWELSVSTSGLTGKNTYHPHENGIIFKFTSNQFQRFNNGKLIESGNYGIKKDSIKILGRIGNKMTFNSNESIFFDIDETYLSFFIDANDGGGTTYKRITD